MCERVLINSPPIFEELHVVLVRTFVDVLHESSIITVNENERAIIVQEVVSKLKGMFHVFLKSHVPTWNFSRDSGDG